MAHPLSRAAELIAQATTITIIGHRRPDADAAGSVLGLALGLAGLDKSVRAAFPDPLPSLYDLLPGVAQAEVVSHPDMARQRPPVDLLVICDTASPELCGALWHCRRSQTLVIDHHYDNRRYGDHNLVQPQAPCTTLVVARLLARLQVPLDPAIASCLYAGLVYDTGRFLHSNTRPDAFRLAARLLAAGADAARISCRLTYTWTPLDLAWQQLALTRMVIDPQEPRLAGLAFNQADLARLGEPDDWSPVSDLPRRLAGIEVSYLLRECADGTLRLGLRSNPPFAVGPVARALGGGGHQQAAGATLRSGLAEALADLVPRLRQVLADQPMQA